MENSVRKDDLESLKKKLNYKHIALKGEKEKYDIFLRSDVYELSNSMHYRKYSSEISDFFRKLIRVSDSNTLIDIPLIDKCITIGNSFLIYMRDLTGGEWDADSNIIIIEADDLG
jgi:hypothetical protein